MKDLQGLHTSKHLLKIKHFGRRKKKNKKRKVPQAMRREAKWDHRCWIFLLLVSSFAANQSVLWKHWVVNRSDYQSRLLHSEWLEYKTATTGTKSGATTGQDSDPTSFKKLHLVFSCTAFWIDDVLGWELPKHAQCTGQVFAKKKKITKIKQNYPETR